MIGLRQKLSLGFGGLLLIILIIGGQSIVQFRELGQSIDVILRENYRSVVACQAMKEALERMDSGILFVLLGYGREGEALIRTNEERFEKALKVELGNITLPGEGEKAKALQDLFTRYRAALRGVMGPAPDRTIRRNLFFREVQPLFQQAKETADDILRMNQGNMNEANEKARRKAAFATQRMVLFLSFGFLIAVAFIFFTGRWILRPIHRLIRSAEEIRGGNLDLVVQTDSRDEIGRLSEAFNDMAASLREFRRSDQAKLSRSQQATQETLDTLSEAVAIVDPEGKIEISTDVAKSLFGIQVGAHLSDLPFNDLHNLFQEVVRDGLPVKSNRTQRIFQRFVNGQERFFSFDASPIRNRERQLTGVILLLKDVTEQRRLDEMKSGLISTVSHQLKTPLTSLRMAVHLLLEEKIGPLNEKQEELLLAAREDSDLLHSILNSLLDISRMESGRQRMALQAVSSDTLVREAIEPFRRTAQDRGVILETPLSADLPPVHADAGRIDHVFSNLLTNALRYTSPGGRITVSAAAEEREVRFLVADTGIGIPRKYLPQIFDRFFRVPDQEQETGAGLGLAIAREIVEAHGGTVRVESREGVGTTFSFTLKRADLASEEEQ
ncbi:MAG: ATP-binding protein [Deltaproteobacteria bacterium]|nr:ATP-binding protein [Deltaproteobacteria bacterium]